MSCTSGIAAVITSNCTTQMRGGLEVTAWAWNRVDMTLTYDGSTLNKITNIAAVGAAKIYKVLGVKNLFDGGHDRVIADNRADTFKHIVSLEFFEKLAANVFAQDAISDLVICVELKDKGTGGDGTFFVYGAGSGLYPASDTRRYKTNAGSRVVSLETLAGQEEKYSSFVLMVTNYATTLALLESID
jgi:hypothetical protein